MNEIFKAHKTCIFKRLQRYQFFVFLEWFGEMPGFEGSVSGDNQTCEQKQCLQQVVYSFNWRRVVPVSGSRSFLDLLERYGGWRYLYFLTNIRLRMEIDAERLYMFSLVRGPEMTGEQAKAMVVCLSRMSWNFPPSIYADKNEVERTAEMRRRVEDRLKFFRKEPPALQKLMTRTLTVLIFHIAHDLRLHKIAAGWQHRYSHAGIASLTRAQIVAGWEDLVSKIMSKTVLGSFFFFGVTNALQLCCEPMNVELTETINAILREFQRGLIDHLAALASGTVPTSNVVDSLFLEGSLWAAGLEFPTVGWFTTECQDGMASCPYRPR